MSIQKDKKKKLQNEKKKKHERLKKGLILWCQCSFTLVQCACSGIEVTLDSMPDNGVILVVTDAGSKQLELENSIREKSLKKNVKISFAFSPSCRALCDDSLPVYNRLSDGRMFNRSDFSSESFFKSVVHTVWNNSIGSDKCRRMKTLNDFVTAQNVNCLLGQVMHPCSNLKPSSPTTPDKNKPESTELTDEL